MTAEGRVAYVHPPTPVDAEFVSREISRGHPERRFRFAGACVEGACPQWTGCGCAIADLAAEATGVDRPPSPGRLPRCSIRRSCRWFFQRGAAACAVCPLIVADMGGTETYQSSHPHAVGEGSCHDEGRSPTSRARARAAGTAVSNDDSGREEGVI
jgi:hypothetical protein